jgi:TIR domain
MATLRDVYTSSHLEGNFGDDLTFEDSVGSFTVNARCHFSFETNTRYASYFLEDPSGWQRQFGVLLGNAQAACDHADSCVQLSMGNPTFGVTMENSTELLFVGRTYLYAEVRLTEEERTELVAAGKARGLSIELRDLKWLDAYNSSTHPLAFLSHDSRDKEDVARPLSLELGRLLCPVWYDEYSLKVGDSLTESIDRGIRQAQKCVIVLSPHFLENPGWSKAEFKAIMNRHIEEGAVLLPVWHNVTRDDVYGYSSFLVDIYGSNTKKGIEAVAADLYRVLKPSNP